MSYSRSYTARVEVSGSRQFSYPKSESGGSKTVHFTEHEDVNITINVDTNQFDSSVNGCNTNLNVLTGAVVVMNTVQCKEITDSASRVSSSIINGFFGMIRSELSQQMVELKNRFESQLVLLNQLSRKMLDYRNVMAGDYARISSRYKDLFDELNKECYRRIFVLDKSCFGLSGTVLKEMIVDSRLNDAGSTMCYTRDINNGYTVISSSRLRSQSSSMISSLKNYILQEDDLARNCATILSAESLNMKQSVYCPILVMENDSLVPETGSSKSTYFIPDNLENNARSSILAETASLEKGSKLTWQECSVSDRTFIDSEFVSLLESSVSSQETEEEKRQNALIVRLWEKSFPQQLVNMK